MKRMLADVCPELINEWSQRNLPLTPDNITFGSNKIVWWKGSNGHSWEAKICERAIEEKGCTICESEYQSAFPQLAISFYACMKGLQIILNSDKVVGLPLETYIPEEKLAIESGCGTDDIEIVKEHICKARGINLIKLPYKTRETEAEYALKLKQTLRNVHIFISSDVDEDVAFIRKRFYEWRKFQ